MEQAKTRPDDRLVVDYSGGRRELFMSFGLLNELMTFVNDLGVVQIIGLDAELRARVLETVFAKRDENGKVTETVSIATLPVSADTVHLVLEWVAGHILDFFLGSLEAAVRAAKPHEDRLKKSMPSGDGSSD